MISGRILGDILSEVVPIYVVMALAYASIKWWKMFSPEQCAGINRFVAMFAIPLVCFVIISNTDMNSLNYRFIGADILQKVIILAFLGVWSKLTKIMCNGGRSAISIDWIITTFALSTLPNTFIVGFPLFKGMYPGEMSLSLLVQIITLQSILWYNILLFLYEYRAAQILINQELSDAGDGGGSSCRFFTPRSSLAVAEEAEIYSVLSSRFSTPRSSSFDRSSSSSRYSTPRGSSFNHSSSDKESTIMAHNIGPNDENRPNMMLNVNVDQPTQMKPSTEEEAIRGKNGPNTIAATTTAQSARVTTWIILSTAGRKMIRNPNTSSSLLGLVWAVISTKYDVKLPLVVARSINLLADGGLGIAIFSLGTFMAMQPTLISGGKIPTLYSTLLRFLVSPTVMAIASTILGLRGTILDIAIIQAAFPQGIVPFVFAKEYNVHPDILSTSVSFGLMIGLPVNLVYYILLDAI